MFESLKANGEEEWYARQQGLMSGMRGPMILGHAQREIPSANRAEILSLQSLCLRRGFVCTGPLVESSPMKVGVQQTFLLLCYAFGVVLPPVVWLFLSQLGKERYKWETVTSG